MSLKKYSWIMRAYKYRYQHRGESYAINYLCRFLKPGQHALDIGAYKGAYTYWMRKCVGPTGQVTAFEPQSQLAILLGDLTESYSNVMVKQLALSDTEGTAEQTIPLEPGQQVSQLASLGAVHPMAKSNSVLSREMVPATSLNAMFSHPRQRPIDFIKCDAEGHELKIFQGGESILLEDRPILLFEAYTKRKDQARESLKVFEYLWGLDYEGFHFKGTKHTLTQIPIPSAQSLPGPYWHNVVFLPRKRAALAA